MRGGAGGDSFSYDTASRLQTVTDNGSGSSATYSYLANSPLVGQIAFANGGQTRMTTTKQYDYLNRLTSISSVPSAAAVVSFAYQYNSANQRTAVTGNDGSYWTYGYDPLGQVTNGFKAWADATLVAGEQFQYGFDTIGNRTRTAAGGDSSGAGLRTANYHANLLNQYTNRDVPAAFDVLGLALATNTTVAVNGLTPYRKSEFFRQQLSVTNTSAAVWQSVTVTATNAGTTTGNVFVAQTPEHFTCDLDGNLASDGHWSYTWDAENRLVGMTNIASAAPAQGLAFGYDWKWRRVQKQVWISGSLTYKTTFLYDEWNLTARLNATNSGLAQSYLWGLDLSGSPQGAGGVGGLLEVSDTANGSHFAAFDGNGNVAALVTAGSGTNAAAYEFGPYGEVIRATGPMAKAHSLRFSTKYQDDETEWLYYGYRFYNSHAGVWSSRDPAVENGGLNLYGFARNNAVSQVDARGLEFIDYGETYVFSMAGHKGTTYTTFAIDVSPLCFCGCSLVLDLFLVTAKSYIPVYSVFDIASPPPYKPYTQAELSRDAAHEKKHRDHARVWHDAALAAVTAELSGVTGSSFDELEPRAQQIMRQWDQAYKIWNDEDQHHLTAGWAPADLLPTPGDVNEDPASWWYGPPPEAAWDPVNNPYPQ